jgi:MFS transporter, DHA3 family, macrolide efflux protein
MSLDSSRGEIRVFAALAVGQLLSIIGSELTFFGLGVWVFQQTGSVTQYALVTMATSVTSMLLAPVAGALVDGSDRRRLLWGASLVGLLTNLGLILLLSWGQLALWNIVIATVLAAAVKTVQSPALAASMPLLVPARHLGRASGLLQLSDGAAQVVAPAVAGLMLEAIQLRGVLLVDCATFMATLLILLGIRLPKTARIVEPGHAGGPRWREVAAGWSYVAGHRGLLGLLAFFCPVNFLIALVSVLVPPFVLKVASTTALGTVTSVSGAGLLFGSVVMTVWGGPKRRLAGIAVFGVLFGLSFMMTGLTHSLPLLALCGFCILFCLALLTGTAQAFWAARVAPQLQGRVYAVRMVLGWAFMSLAYLVAGPLTDGFLEPLLTEEGPWAQRLGAVVGTGPGRGIALLFVLMGALCILSAVVLYLPRVVRRLDDEQEAGSLQGTGTSFTS